MRLLRETFETLDHKVVVASLMTKRGNVVLSFDCDHEKERYILGAEEQADDLTSSVTDMIVTAEFKTWDDLQYEAEQLLSDDFWNS